MNDGVDSRDIIGLIARTIGDCKFCGNLELDYWDYALRFKNDRGDEFKISIEKIRHS